MKRCEFLKTGAGAVAAAPFINPVEVLAKSSGAIVNDVHAQLNETVVHDITRPLSTQSLMKVISNAQKAGRPVSVSGARHAMGGQQFGTNGALVDMRGMDKIIAIDVEKKTVEVEAGITWPKLIGWLNDTAPQLAVIQKQTGADELTLGGALASNIHGRSLTKQPFISDVVSFTLVTSGSKRITCSRDENAELFRLAIGGYGLFGVIDTVKFRLGDRHKVKRVAEVATTKDLMEKVARRVDDGYLYGDFQYMTDEKSDGFMRDGIFTCYGPVPDETPVSESSHDLNLDAWKGLYRLAHLDKQRAWQVYRDHYLATNGQVYFSDAHQTGIYLKDFNREFAREQKIKPTSSLMLSEVYVPRDRFVELMEQCRAAALGRKMDVIYGTVRFIKQDTESFLAWAKQDYACVIFNLHIIHTKEGIAKAQEDFRALYDIALNLGGSYYLTYHKWARKDQAEQAYPQLPEFLELKKKYDPLELFQSDWYRHYKKMFA